MARAIPPVLESAPRLARDRARARKARAAPRRSHFHHRGDTERSFPMIDIAREIEATTRTTGDRKTRAGRGKAVVLRREYEAPIDEVWDAITSPARISRWFLPVSGDFRVGGRYQLEGNAGG